MIRGSPDLSMTSALLGLFLLGVSVHTGHAAAYERAIMLIVDGLHPVDLSYWSSKYPIMKDLVNDAVVYNNMFVDALTDTFPSSVALYSGGVGSCGAIYSPAYDRSIYSADQCSGGKPIAGAVQGGVVEWSQDADLDPTILTGGGGADYTKYPFDSKCRRLTPFNYTRCNTIFEVVQQAGHVTAFSEKEVAPFELLRGPSGKGVTDLYNIESNANDPFPPFTAASPGKDNLTKEVTRTVLFDAEHMKAVLNWVQGKSGDGQSTLKSVPKLFGSSFQSLSAAQKYTSGSDPSLVGGYTVDGSGKVTPNTGIQYALQKLDDQLGLLVAALKAKNLYDTTLIAIGGKHGQSPINPAQLRKPVSTPLINLLESNSIKVKFILHGTSVVLWLEDKTKAAKAAFLARKLNEQKCDTTNSSCWYKAIYNVMGGNANGLWKMSINDVRSPDIILNMTQGVIVDASKTKLADRGGLSKDETQVAWLFANPKITAATKTTRTSTKQVPATLLEQLGFSSRKLTGVVKENTQPLTLA